MNRAFNAPALSIITVSAYDPLRLEITLNSLCGVSDLGLEHVTVLPKDDTESIALWTEKCQKYTNFLLRHDENKGIYKAMNLGALTSSGKFVAFWNSGEQITSRSEIELLLIQLRETLSPQVITQGQIEWLPNHIQDFDEYFAFLSGAKNRFISHQTYFLRRDEFLESGGFLESYKVAADTDLILRNSNKQIEIILDIQPVFVEDSRFARLNHRRARLEDIAISIKYSLRARNLWRLRNLVTSEFANLKDKFFSLFEVSTWVPRKYFRARVGSNTYFNVVNYGRAFVVDQFARNLEHYLGESEVQRVAIIGGSLSDPEAIVLASKYPEAKLITVGIEDAQYLLDLNLISQAHIPSSEILLVSQVIEHVWNHENFFSNIFSLVDKGGLVWVGCPASNKVHGSPEFYSAGFNSGYLSKNLTQRGMTTLCAGGFGTKRLYWATHLIPGWFSRRAHAFPLFFAFDDRGCAARWLLRFRFAPVLLMLSFISPFKTSNERWETESWWMGIRD